MLLRRARAASRTAPRRRSRSAARATSASRSRTGCAGPSRVMAPPASDRCGKATTRLGSKNVTCAQAVAARAGAHRVVEREEARLELGERVAADRAGELRREEVLLARCRSRPRPRGRRRGAAPSRTIRRGAASHSARRRLQPVDHDLDRVLAFLRSSLRQLRRSRAPCRRCARARSPARAARRTDPPARPCGRRRAARGSSRACPRAARARGRPSAPRSAPASAMSCSGQYGVPTRAKSRRR